MNPESIQIDHHRSEIEICTGCGGAGRLELNPIRLPTDEPAMGTCKKCEGSGRIRKLTVIKYRKFSTQQ